MHRGDERVLLFVAAHRLGRLDRHGPAHASGRFGGHHDERSCPSAPSPVSRAERFSCPSGHAAAALSVALGAALAVPAALPALLALGLAVDVSRYYLGVHCPGDVVAGRVLAGAAFGTGGRL